jgi:hypothetical protein
VSSRSFLTSAAEKLAMSGCFFFLLFSG